ncbi:MAG: hypothetical protein AAGA21_17680 [Pseudomonadota bacterium]
MKTLIPACLFALVVSLSPSLASAQSDCHESMKTMLDGTLEVIGEVENQRSEASPSDSCTLANLKDQLRIVAST